MRLLQAMLIGRKNMASRRRCGLHYIAIMRHFLPNDSGAILALLGLLLSELKYPRTMDRTSSVNTLINYDK